MAALGKAKGVLLNWAKKALLNWMFTLPSALLIYLVLGPIILLILTGFKPGGLIMNPGWTLSNYLEVYSEVRTFRLLGNTLVFATGSTLVTLLISISLAWLVERTNVPFKNWLRITIIAPMGVPMMLTAMGWVLLASPRIGFLNVYMMKTFNLSDAPLNIFTLSGMILVQGIVGVSGAFLLLSFSFRNMDPDFEDASLVSGQGPFSTLRGIVLPILRPGILGVAVLMFMYGLASFDVPGIIGMSAGVNVFALKIFMAIQQPQGIPEFGQVSAIASIYFLVVLGLTYFYNRQTKLAASFATITGREFRPKITDLGWWKYVSFAGIMLYLLFCVVLPLGILVWQSLLPYIAPFSSENLHLASLKNWRSMLAHPLLAMALKNTLVIALVSATSLVILGTLISWIIVRSRFVARRALDLVCMLPLALPHIMLALALIFVYLTFRVGIYGTIWIIVVAFVTTYITYSTRLLNSTMFQIHKELEEVAQVSGASKARVFRTVIVPLLAPSMIGLWVWVVVHAMRELSAALMLQSRRSIVLTTLMYHMWERGDVPLVATIGVGLVFALFVLMGVGQLVAQRFALITGKR